MTDLSLKISDQDIDFIKLVLRSTDIGGGWRRVSKALEDLVNIRVSQSPDLYIINIREGQMFIKLSADAEVLGAYL